MDYIIGHPLKESLECPEVVSHIGPDSLQKIAQFFANKKMSRNQIQQSVRNVLTNREEQQQLIMLGADLEKLIQRSEEQNSEQGINTTDFTETMKRFYADVKEPDQNFEKAVTMYDEILRDLSNKVTYVAPTAGQTNWEKYRKLTNSN
jgi:hypothetical protein